MVLPSLVSMCSAPVRHRKHQDTVESRTEAIDPHVSSRNPFLPARLSRIPDRYASTGRALLPMQYVSTATNRIISKFTPDVYVQDIPVRIDANQLNLTTWIYN